MIAKIIPGVRLPNRASPIYDYTVPVNLVTGFGPGTVVAVPFAGRLVAGLVVSVSEARSERELKEVYGVFDAVTYPHYWVKLIAEVAARFATTAPRFAWTMLPPLMRKSILTCCESPFNFKPAEVAPAIFEEKIICAEGQNDVLAAFAAAVANGGDGQTVVIVPTVEEAERWAKEREGAVVFHSRLSDGEKYRVYAAAARGEAKLIVGTKSAVFLPCKNLRAVLLLHAGSSAHLNEDLDPRYDGRVVARLLARAANAKLIMVDALPPLALGVTSNKPLAISDERFAVCDLNDAAARARVKVLLCDQTIDAATETLGKGGRALFLLNRRGTGSAMLCADCGRVVLCPACRVPLLALGHELQCFACGKKYPLPLDCPHCHGTNFKTIGSGVKGLYNHLKKMFPSAKAVLIEGGAASADPDEFDLVVGTTAVFHHLQPRFKPFDLAVEALLGAGTGQAGVYAVEATGRILRELKATLSDQGRLIVQTYDKTSHALLALAAPEKFIANELEERQVFAYPPFGKIVALTGAGKAEDKLYNEAKGIVAELAKTALASVSEPTWDEPKLFRGKYRLRIIAKAGARQDLDFLVKYLPSGWNAEVKEL